MLFTNMLLHLPVSFVFLCIFVHFPVQLSHDIGCNTHAWVSGELGGIFLSFCVPYTWKFGLLWVTEAGESSNIERLCPQGGRYVLII